MTPIYRMELDEALQRIRRNNLNLNRPLAEKLALLSAICFLASLPLLMILGWGGYVWPLMTIAAVSGVGSYFLFRSVPPGCEESHALVVFTAPGNIIQVSGSGRTAEYRLILDGRQLPVSRSIWQAMPHTGEAAVFLTEKDEKIFYITRAGWIDRSRLELVTPAEENSVLREKKKNTAVKPRRQKNVKSTKGKNSHLTDHTKLRKKGNNTSPDLAAKRSKKS